MSLTRLLALALGFSLIAPHVADAKKKKADEEEEPAEDEAPDEEAPAEDEEEEEKPAKKKGKATEEAEPEPEEEEAKPEKEFVKQNLSGHDMGTQKKANQFESDRFYVDKVDTKKTAKGTLIQGSITSTTFLYTEKGGNYAAPEGVTTPQGENSARFSRLYTDLRLQTDFRHLGGGRWDARIDARARVLKNPSQDTANTVKTGGGTFSDDTNHIQSGFNGTNELDLRELWLFRSGKRSDIFFGRQFVADLGGVKFDGLRIDYAQSQTFTLIGFGGLYPVRGSRSLTTDYKPLIDEQGNSAGRLVGTGGFGAAYRTQSAYGAFGGVALVPLKGETPRIFATSTGYYRRGASLDIYHFALVDLYSSASPGTGDTSKVALTNLSAGVNYKPSPRLRITGGYNRVDVDTLSVQAYAFLDRPDASPTNLNVENDTFFRRLATTSARAGISAGLGHQQRFEISLGAAYRYRKTIRLPIPNGMGNDVLLQGTRGVELTGSLLDRESIANLRLGLDITRTIGLGDGTGDIAFMRSEVFAGRVYAGRELKSGHGEWEAEVSYASTKDSASTTMCGPTSVGITGCYGSSTGSILSGGGNLYYRLNRDWFLLTTLFLSRQQLDSIGNGAVAPAVAEVKADPNVYGVTGFFRASYRF